MSSDDARRAAENEAMRRFLRRVWRHDVAPLLGGKRSESRAKAARVGGKVAAAAGLLADGLFRLKGKPFTRAMTVMGASVGAMLPDVWDWKWFRSADERQKRVVSEQVERRAGELSVEAALEMFGLTKAASREDLKQTWRSVTQRCHPDKASGVTERAEFHLRFVTYNAAHERLCQAFDAGELPCPKDTA